MITAASRKSDGEGGLTFALQALLSRHEFYIAESEEERRMMAATMSRLEDDRRSLEAENARVVQENKELLDQLEGMDTQIANSDAHIESLRAMLNSAQFENKRLIALAAKTADLEAQLMAMEIGQAKLQEELTTTQEDERSAVRRWKDAEIRLRDLDDQIQQMEREARDERERHVEVMGRMDRRTLVEKELESAAGGVKGAAAAETIGRDKNGTNVVSHFVRDILHDNANLQAGILELRELLHTSNEEVQNLREQVLEHQPILTDAVREPASLMGEIEQCRPKVIAQEVHVHHHYHAKIAVNKEKRPGYGRLPRRRGHLSPVSNPSAACQTPLPRRGSNLGTMPRPGLRVNRWSTQSSATDFSAASSGPSSSYSDHRTSSIFDRIDPGFESSRPTSPESAGFLSPRFPFRANCGSNITELTDVSEDEIPSSTLRSADAKQRVEERQPLQVAIPDLGVSHLRVAKQAVLGASKDPPATESPTLDHASAASDTLSSRIILDQLQFEPLPLCRSDSHESLVSISGMNIHLARQGTRPQRLLPEPTSPSGTSEHLNFSIPFPSPQPLASIAEVHASSSNMEAPTIGGCPSSLSLLSGLTAGKSSQPAPKGLGHFVGSWVRGRWGIAPTASARNLREQATSGDWSPRMPGINQKGPITGWKPPDPAPSEVHPKMLDEGLLKESLAE